MKTAILALLSALLAFNYAMAFDCKQEATRCLPGPALAKMSHGSKQPNVLLENAFPNEETKVASNKLVNALDLVSSSGLCTAKEIFGVCRVSKIWDTISIQTLNVIAARTQIRTDQLFLLAASNDATVNLRDTINVISAARYWFDKMKKAGLTNADKFFNEKGLDAVISLMGRKGYPGYLAFIATEADRHPLFIQALSGNVHARDLCATVVFSGIPHHQLLRDGMTEACRWALESGRVSWDSYIFRTFVRLDWSSVSFSRAEITEHLFLMAEAKKIIESQYTLRPGSVEALASINWNLAFLEGERTFQEYTALALSFMPRSLPNNRKVKLMESTTENAVRSSIEGWVKGGKIKRGKLDPKKVTQWKNKHPEKARRVQETMVAFQNFPAKR